MNKPLSMIIKETKMALAKTCNDSNLSPVILDMILRDIYNEIHILSEKQFAEEENIYMKSLEVDKEEQTS